MEQESSFSYTGINHTRIQDKDGHEFHYVLDHTEHASAIHPVTLPELMKMKDNDPLEGLLHNCFMTLLGATAWLLQTRMEVAVYVSALQRQMRSARAIDLRRLNRVIRWVQRNPRGLTYQQLPEPRVLLAIGDSAFQAPTDEEMEAGSNPLVMRGYILAWAHRIDERPPTTTASSGGSAYGASPAGKATTTIKPKVPNGVTIGHRKYVLQVIGYTAGKQNHVCRGVWSSELHNQCDMIEMASIISGFTLETLQGPQSGESLKNALATGNLPMKIEALTDSYSIFSYLAAAHLKLPAEKSTYYHLAYLREKLVSRHIRSYSWTDTRDMVADGLTKGTADRAPLAAIMDGHYKLDHAVHEYVEPTAASSSEPSTSTGNQNFTTSGSKRETVNQNFLYIVGLAPAVLRGAGGEFCLTNLARKTASLAHDDIVYERASTASVSSQLCDRSGGSAYGASPAEITRRGEYPGASRLNSLD